MYINDMIKDFFEVISGQQVLLLVHYDIDAICTCKMLQWLFQSQEILYTIVPIETILEMKEAFQGHIQKTKYVIFLNCGGTIDLINELEPDEDVVIFVIDSHRPSDLCNIYSSSQIRMISPPGEDEEIPNFNDVFHSSDEESEDESYNEEEEEEEAEGEDMEERENNESRQAKRLRLAEETAVKRRRRREWQEKKNRLLFEYSQFTYYGKCSSVLVHELLWRISKGNLDVLWYAIVGLTSCLLNGDKTQESYLEDMQVLKRHVDELTAKAKLDEVLDESHVSDRQRKPAFISESIYSEMDMNLAIYRHWTVEASLRHSMCTAVHLKLWTKKGEQRLHQILAEMGLPLVQSRQMFKSMDLSLRKNFYDMMTKVADAHNLDSLVFPSFSLRLGYTGQYYASEYVYALISLLNTPYREKSTADCFLECLDCLNRKRKDLLEIGFEGSKRILAMLFRQVQIYLDMKQVLSAGTFLYFVIQDGAVEAQFFSHPPCLIMLAKFMLRAYHQLGGGKRKVNKFPLIASAPFDSSQLTSLVVGIPPVTEFTNRNFFGKAFEQAASNIGCQIEMDYFDTSVVRIKTEDRTKFLDSLAALLA